VFALERQKKAEVVMAIRQNQIVYLDVHMISPSLPLATV
jgi:hypothetical protein